jgi:hypothetical protein
MLLAMLGMGVLGGCAFAHRPWLAVRAAAASPWGRSPSNSRRRVLHHPAARLSPLRRRDPGGRPLALEPARAARRRRTANGLLTTSVARAPTCCTRWRTGRRPIHGHSGIRTPLHHKLYEKLRGFPSEASFDALAHQSGSPTSSCIRQMYEPADWQFEPPGTCRHSRDRLASRFTTTAPARSISCAFPTAQLEIRARPTDRRYWQTVSHRKFLYHARINRQLTLEQIGLRTALSPTVLRHIDEGRFELLPSGVYARSYVRAFATAVGLNPEEALAQVEPYLPGYPTPSRPCTSRRPSRPGNGSPGGWPPRAGSWQRPAPVCARW